MSRPSFSASFFRGKILRKKIYLSKISTDKVTLLYPAYFMPILPGKSTFVKQNKW